MAGALVALLACGLAAGWGGWRAARHEADELFDAQLAQVGQTLLALGHAGEGDIAREPGRTAHPYQTRLVFQVWRREADEDRNRLLMRSASAGPAPLPVHGDGYSTTRLAGAPYRFYAQTDPEHGVRAVVGQSLAIRGELERRIAWNNAWPFLLVLPLWALAVAWLVNRALSPVRRLAGDVGARNADNLEPVAPGQVPDELQPLVMALNALLLRVAAAMENERRFTGDAAHELRTPMAALRAQLDAVRLATDGDIRDAAIRKAGEALERMGRLVTQLLTLARLEGAAGPAGEPADLAVLAGEACGEAAPAAVAKGIDLSLEGGSAPVRGEPEALAILIRNLVDNALRYTPAGGRVVVSTGTRPGAGPLLRVADNGPGVPAERRIELGRRFLRLAPGAAEGVGLGLSIVRRIAERHDATVGFDEGLDGRGLSVGVGFPL